MNTLRIFLAGALGVTVPGRRGVAKIAFLTHQGARWCPLVMGGATRRHYVGWLQGVVASLAIAMICGCTPHSFAGIDLRPGRAPAEVQALAARAQAGDKQAQLELGMRYERGQDVSLDLARARHLYRLAAADTGGKIFVYQPPLRKGGSGGVVAVDMGPVTPGLSEARARLRGATSGAKSNGPTARDPANGPSAAVIEAAYVRWANWTCAQLIDVCPDDALVLPTSVHVEKVECDVQSDRATCAFDILKYGNRERCRSSFKLEPGSGKPFWTVETERNRPRTLKPKIECQSS